MRNFASHYNPLALLLSTVASFFISSLWYGPIFGEIWLEYSPFNRKKLEDIRNDNKYLRIAIAILATLFTAFVFEIVIHTVGISNYVELLVLALVVSLGFIGPNMIYDVIWGKTKLINFFINLGYQFVNLLVQGAIICALDDFTTPVNTHYNHIEFDLTQQVQNTVDSVTRGADL